MDQGEWVEAGRADEEVSSVTILPRRRMGNQSSGTNDDASLFAKIKVPPKKPVFDPAARFFEKKW